MGFLVAVDTVEGGKAAECRPDEGEDGPYVGFDDEEGEA